MKLLKLGTNAVAIAAAALAVVSLFGLPLASQAIGLKTYTVMSGSMEPAIHTGSVLVAQPVAPETLHVGDVIVYNLPNSHESVTHRIIEVKPGDNGKPAFVTRG